MKVESEVAQSCPTPSDPMDSSLPGPPSTGFSRQEYWSGLPLPSPKSIKMFVNEKDTYKKRRKIMYKRN